MTTLADIADPLDLTVSATYDVHNPTPPLPFLPNEVLDSRVAFITFWTKNSIRESSDDQLYSLFGPLISGWQGPTHQTQEKPPAHLTRYDWFLQQEIAHTSRFRDANRNEVEATLADIRRWIRDDLEFAFLPTETHYELLLRTHPSWFDIDDGLDFTEQVQENVDNLYSLLAFHHRIPGHENIIYITPVLFILRTMLHDACYQGDRIRGFKALDIAIYETVSHEMVHFIGTKVCMPHIY
jgi:hypothetical protein